ncbi:MAG: aromatic ring-hydroxylating dioxygenase subunit alpha [Rhodobiaceae bacterium]|nr:aromatic ring-hydroxylating dioxygenase subunit alpha [Rhodobiaceae bacterium]MCC0053176.1 aromatic ring-hydroxylating dioxygenase subunit alpha [Rhodobiaceae bacterium]
MAGDQPFASGFNGLARAQASLPAAWYSDPDQYAREMAAIWTRSWLPFCRTGDLPDDGTYHAGELAGRNIVAVRKPGGDLAAFHNVCRHRGAEMCAAGSGRLQRPLLVCPYHAWAYDLAGRLVATGPARAVQGFDRARHPLLPVGIATWGGFIFINLAGGSQADFEAALGAELAPLANWPLDTLEVAHVDTREIACNWKVFWENFNECLHCPGIHPDLCDLVPIYGRGIMVREDDPDWRSHAGETAPRWSGALRDGAATWADGGLAQGQPLPGLSEADVARGHTYGVALPGIFVVGHVDYVRAVTVTPLGPQRMRLTATWFLPPGRRDEPGFDLERITRFAIRVLGEDAAACELNQRGLASAPFEAGTLMQEEYEVYAFHRWVRARLGEGEAAGSRAGRRAR